MNLSFSPEPSTYPPYPNGYWYAVTDDGEYDADGNTPLTAITKLCLVLEEEVKGDK